jgi:hypothetical protein
LASATGNKKAAFEELRVLILEGTDIAPRAMSNYFELGVAIEYKFSEGDFALSEALRFENRASKAADRLAVAQLAAHIAQDDFSQARALLRQVAEIQPEAVRIALTDQFLKQALTKMTDAEFGRLIWSEEVVPTDPLLKRDIATRLEAMGFEQRASAILNEDTQIETVPTPSENEENSPPRMLERPESTTIDPNPQTGQLEPQFDDTPTDFVTAVNPSLAEANSLLQASEASRDFVRDQLQDLQVD